MTANIDMVNKRRYGYGPPGTGKPTTRDHIAPGIVRGWSPEQARRIRGILMVLSLGDLGAPEMDVVTMIDRRH